MFSIEASQKVTVVILTYNRAKYLKEAIKGALSQTYRNFELLILDNASNDDSASIIQHYSDPRIRHIRHLRNMGSGYNYFYAFNNVCTPYMIIVHDDDVMKPRMIEREIEVLDTYPDIAVVGSQIDIIDNCGNFIHNGDPAKKDLIYAKNKFIEAYCKDISNFIPFPTVMYRMEFIKKNNLQIKEEIGPSADVFFLFNINSIDCNIYVIGEPLYLYRIHEKQDTSQNYLEMNMKLFFHASKYLSCKKNKYLIPHLKKSLRASVVNRAISDLLKKQITRRKFKKFLALIRKSELWGNDNSLKLRSKIFLSQHFPYLFGEIMSIKNGNHK